MINICVTLPIFSETKIKRLIVCEGFWLSGFIVLPVQLSIQTTESLQNKVGRKNTKQEKIIKTTTKKKTNTRKPKQEKNNKKRHKEWQKKCKS